MNKFDKYYLKEGKLELSILEEDIEENEYVVDELSSINPQKGREPRIKLTEDIYNTLHTMGKLLTKEDNGLEEMDEALYKQILLPVKEQLAYQKVQKVQKNVQINKTIIFEEEEQVVDRELSQSSIDELLLFHFGKVTPQYEHAEKLKGSIDKQIAAINNYK